MMINNAAGSGGNQEDFIPEENNQGRLTTIITKFRQR